MAHSESIPMHKPTVDMWTTGTGQVKSNILNILVWNVNGFNSVKSKGALDKVIQSFGEQIDFLCLNETKVGLQKLTSQRKKQSNIFHKRDDLYEYWNFCKVSNGYSGVMTYSKEPAKKVIQDMPQAPQHSLQGRMLTLQYEKFYLINLYKPNSGAKLNRLQYRMDFQNCLSSFVSELQQTKPVVLVGDMNVALREIDLFNPKASKKKPGFSNEQRLAFNQMLKDCGLKDTFRELHPTKVQYTWWAYQGQARQNNQGWRIDYILTDKRIKILQAKIIDQVTGSDHCPIFAKIQLIDSS